VNGQQWFLVSDLPPAPSFWTSLCPVSPLLLMGISTMSAEQCLSPSSPHHHAAWVLLPRSRVPEAAPRSKVPHSAASLPWSQLLPCAWGSLHFWRPRGTSGIPRCLLHLSNSGQVPKAFLEVLAFAPPSSDCASFLQCWGLNLGPYTARQVLYYLIQAPSLFCFSYIKCKFGDSRIHFLCLLKTWFSRYCLPLSHSTHCGP
jgi:hypothetical protein